MKKIFGFSLLAMLFASGIAIPVAAQTTSTSTSVRATADLVCMQNAVEKRDSAVIAAVDAYHASVKAALTARKDALKAAWGIADRDQRKAALRTAAQSFKESLKTARRVLKDAKHSTWKQFYEERKTCHVNGNSDDKVSEGIDAGL